MNLHCSLAFDDMLKSSVSCRLQIAPKDTYGIGTKEPNRRHRCGTGQEPSEGR